MGNLASLKSKFDNAQRALLQILFSTDESQNNPIYVQMALDHMSQAFNALLIHAFDAPEKNTSPQAQEILCAHAINQGNEWTSSCWQVAFINGNFIPEPQRISVADFTRKMLTNGWKTLSLPECPSTLRAPDGENVALLYFCRKDSNSETAWVLELPHPRNSILSSN